MPSRSWFVEPSAATVIWAVALGVLFAALSAAWPWFAAGVGVVLALEFAYVVYWMVHGPPDEGAESPMLCDVDYVI